MPLCLLSKCKCFDKFKNALFVQKSMWLCFLAALNCTSNKPKKYKVQTILYSLCIFLRRTDRNDHVIFIIQLSCLNDDGTSITIRVYRVCLQFIHACYYNNKMRKYQNQQSSIFNIQLHTQHNILYSGESHHYYRKF